MTDDMNVEGEGTPQGPDHGAPWYAAPAPPRPDAPMFPPPDEAVARPRRSALTVVLAGCLAVLVLVGSRHRDRHPAAPHRDRPGESSTPVSASFADKTGVVDIDTFTTRHRAAQGTGFSARVPGPAWSSPGRGRS